MSHSPSVPDRPHLELDPDMPENERFDALRGHFVEVARVNEELQHRLAEARSHNDDLGERVDRIERENAALKTSSLYIATVEDLFEDEIVVKQHGNNQEVLTETSPRLRERVDHGMRVAVDDSFTVQSLLPDETDARAQAMELDESPEVSYEDIGGLEDQLVEVRETVEMPLDRPEMFEEVGIDPPSGVLLYGPPGTGKTMLAKAVANRTDATFIKMAGSELVQKFIGEGAKLVRDLFTLAEEREPSVLFIDEIDAIASKRTDSKTSGDAEVQRTMMQLLNDMDGFEERGEVRIIAATNRFDMLDRAILRPGRFDRLIEVPKPDQEGREKIFEIHTRGINVADDVDFERLAAETEEFSGAEIKSLTTEAGMFAIRDDRTEVTTADLRDAHEKLTDDESRGAVISSPGELFYAR
jgi:proteasome regulatory subunit